MRGVQAQVNFDRISHNCCICHAEGFAPDLVPYLGKTKGHVWAHPQCAQQAFELKRQREPVAELDFASYSEVQR